MDQKRFEAAFNRLNPEQKTAVLQTEGPVLVMAGPGTGKTQIIALRIAQILKETQMNPYNILCLSFTESGVVAMKERLSSLIGSAAYAVKIHTFHSFSNEIIQEFPEQFAHTRALEPIGDLDKLLLFRELLDEAPDHNPLKPFGFPYLYLKDIQKGIQDLKREDISPEEFKSVLEKIQHFLDKNLEQIESFLKIHARSMSEKDFEFILSILKGSPLHYLIQSESNTSYSEFKARLKKAVQELKSHLPKQFALYEIYKNYQARLKKNANYDYEDMVLFVIQALKTNETLLSHYQEQIQYILVDEFQDANRAQNELVTLLGSFFEAPNIFAVGDEKQSIYRFQGASLENLLDFKSRYAKDLQIIHLKENYRSKQSILNAAHQLIPEGTEPLNSQSQDQNNCIFSFETETEQDEFYAVAQQIQSLIQGGTPANEIAVLFRNHWHANGLSELLSKMEIPFSFEAGKNLLEIREIQGMIELLRYIVNPEDAQLFFILHYHWLHFHALDIHRLAQKAAKEKKLLFDAALESEIFQDFAKKILKWRKDFFNLTFLKAFEQVHHESGFFKYALEEAEQNKLPHLLNATYSLFEELKRWNRSNLSLNPIQVLERLHLMQEYHLNLNEEPLPEEKSALRLMTVHKSKGLEFDHVFILKCADHFWGNARKINKLKLPPSLLAYEEAVNRDVNAEEQRLFYVALTRARNSIYLSRSLSNERGQAQSPSVFLQELQDHLVPVDLRETFKNSSERLSYFLKQARNSVSQEEQNFVKELLKNYKMSVTHLNNYLECPRLFYYRNLIRVPALKNLHLAYGTAVHGALKDFMVQFKNQEDLPDLAYLLKQFESYLNREILSPQEFSSALSLGKQNLQQYYESKKESFHKGVITEYSFATHQVELDGISLTGQLDKIEFLDPQGTKVKVVDYKTGNPDNKSAELKVGGNYHRQIVFYKLLTQKSTRFKHEMSYGEIEFLEKSKKDQNFKTIRIDVTEEDLNRLNSEIKLMMEELNSLSFLDSEKVQYCGTCEFCKSLSG